MKHFNRREHRKSITLLKGDKNQTSELQLKHNFLRDNFLAGLTTD